MSVEQGSTVHDSTEPVPLQGYHQTKFKKYKNEEEDRGAVLETSPLSFIFLVSALVVYTPNLSVYRFFLTVAVSHIAAFLSTERTIPT